jgi:hypothetical protein
MAIIQLHDRIVRDALRELAGREIKHTGDGIMASFFSAVAAARCATRIHRALAQYEQEKTGVPFKVRIGAAAGEPVEDHRDLFGSTVQLAARLCSHAQPEQSLVSNVVAELCIGKGLAFQDLGEVSFKGFERPSECTRSSTPATSRARAAPHSLSDRGGTLCSRIPVPGEARSTVFQRRATSSRNFLHSAERGSRLAPEARSRIRRALYGCSLLRAVP